MSDTVRSAIAEYIRAEAQPPDKWSHQPRLYHIATRIADDLAYDDDVVYAAAWLHDIGVFVGHRPEERAALEHWDNVAYALELVPALLTGWGFPHARIPAVLDAIRTHLPWQQPTTVEGVILRDADILEQLGAIGIMRIVSKVGRDTRYPTFTDALRQLQRNVDQLPDRLALPAAQRLAEPRIQYLRAFLAAAVDEADGMPL